LRFSWRAFRFGLSADATHRGLSSRRLALSTAA
jgi:hypothetical protein